jgi:hypothetical protein
MEHHYLDALEGRARYLAGRLNVELSGDDFRRPVVQREFDAVMWALDALRGGGVR